MNNGFAPPPDPRAMIEKLKEPKPKSLKEVPSYLKKVIGGFFSRLFYIVRLVWEARPFLLFLMVFMAIFDGIMPVIGSLISANLLNKLYIVLTHLETLGEPASFSLILTPLLLQFGFPHDSEDIQYFCPLRESIRCVHNQSPDNLTLRWRLFHLSPKFYWCKCLAPEAAHLRLK